MPNPYPADIEGSDGTVRISGKVDFTDPANQPGGFIAFSGVEVHLSTNLTGLAVGVPQPITYDVADYDTDSYFDPLTPTLITVPADGIYLITVSAEGSDDVGLNGFAYVSATIDPSGPVVPDEIAPYDGIENVFGLILTNVARLVAGSVIQPNVNLRISGGTTYSLYKENTHCTVTKLGVPP